MQIIRCMNCNKMLFKGTFNQVEIKCPRCKRIITVSNASEHPTEKYCGKREKITGANETRRR